MADNLLALITSGKLRPGAELHHTGRGLSDRTVTATVAENGIRFRGRAFTTPSAAAKVVTGRPVDGWIFWKLPSGEPLGSLRSGAAPSDEQGQA